LARTLEEFLLKLSLGNFDFNSLVDLLGVSAFVVGIVLNGSREQGIDECSLPETRFTSDLGIVSSAVDG